MAVVEKVGSDLIVSHVRARLLPTLFELFPVRVKSVDGLLDLLPVAAAKQHQRRLANR